MAKRSKRTKPRPVRPYGSLRLRRLLKLSDQVDLETVCDEAADEIDQLRSRPTSNRLRDPFDGR